jgi:hypothetical protein
MIKSIARQARESHVCFRVQIGALLQAQDAGICTPEAYLASFLGTYTDKDARGQWRHR